MTSVHMRHCNQGENEGCCKYGEDDTCPAMVGYRRPFAIDGARTNAPKHEDLSFEDDKGLTGYFIGRMKTWPTNRSCAIFLVAIEGGGTAGDLIAYQIADPRPWPVNDIEWYGQIWLRGIDP